MDIETLATILMGMGCTLQTLRNEPAVRRIEESRYFHTSNDLIFDDIQLVINEFLQGLLDVQNAELEQANADIELAKQIQKPELNQRQ